MEKDAQLEIIGAISYMQEKVYSDRSLGPLFMEFVASPFSIERIVREIEESPPLRAFFDEALSLELWEKRFELSLRGGLSSLDELPPEHARLLLLTLALKGLFPRGLADGRVFRRDKFWRHCIYTAFASELIAAEEGEDAFGCFLYGLLHDVGVLFLDRYLPSTLDKIFNWAVQLRLHLVSAEVDFLGISHADVGGWALNALRYPEDFYRVVRFHHSPQFAGTCGGAIRIVAKADIVSSLLFMEEVGVESSQEAVEKIQKDFFDNSLEVPLLIESIKSAARSYGELERLDEMGFTCSTA